MLKAALAAWRFQYRSARFLGLKKERIIFIGKKQLDIAARSDAADTDNFYCRILEAVAIEQFKAIGLQRFSILLKVVTAGLLPILDVLLEVEEDWGIIFN